MYRHHLDRAAGFLAACRASEIHLAVLKMPDVSYEIEKARVGAVREVRRLRAQEIQICLPLHSRRHRKHHAGKARLLDHAVDEVAYRHVYRHLLPLFELISKCSKPSVACALLVKACVILSFYLKACQVICVRSCYRAVEHRRKWYVLVRVIDYA